MSKVSAILDGFKNYYWKNPLVEEIAMQRIEVCGECSSLSDLIYLHCRECGCYIKAKIRSMDKDNKCPLNKWIT